MTREQVLNEKTDLLQEFLKATQSLAKHLSSMETPEGVELIQKEVEKRDNIIERVNALNTVLEQLGEPDAAQRKEQDKQSWLWQQLLEQVQAFEEANTQKLQEIMGTYREKTRNAKTSIRVIDAYSRQMSEDDDTANVDKSK